jgi:hypothetical protein
MKHPRGKHFQNIGFPILVLGVLSPLVVNGQTSQAARKPNAPRTLILEVVNRHFTVGEKIPSTYLKIYSDGTAECHTLKYWDEPDVAKTKSLPIEEFNQLKALLEHPDLLSVKHRYERMYSVMDSWMEWTIKIEHPSGEQSFEVSGFSPSSAKASRQPYPEVLTKLGCSIQKIRSEVFGYEPHRAEADCDSNPETPH